MRTKKLSEESEQKQDSSMDSSMEGVNCNTKLTKKFISVAAQYSFLQQPHID